MSIDNAKWAMVAALSVIVLGCGLWVILKQPPKAKRSTQLPQSSILMEHVAFTPQVYKAHGFYPEQLHNEASPIIVYRYSPAGCSPCYHEDLFELEEFGNTIGIDKILVLPSYSAYDRNSRIQISNEIREFNYRNIPPDSLAIPVSVREGEKRYFAVLDADGHVDMVFFPARGQQKLTRQYFQMVAARYFNQ